MITKVVAHGKSIQAQVSPFSFNLSYLFWSSFNIWDLLEQNTLLDCVFLEYGYSETIGSTHLMGNKLSLQGMRCIYNEYK